SVKNSRGSINGNLNAVSDTILDSSKEAVQLCILMFGVVGVWSGIMNVAVSLGLVRKLERLIAPFLKLLFPRLRDKEAKEYISTNIVANLLGLGWAATPSGIKAMKALDRINPHKGVATREMCMFLILNISSLQLIPVTMIAYRSQYGSINPTAIVGPALAATLFSTLVGIAACKILDR
ncbi:MAG: nucleoside recognition protein, partial [Clostridiales bacterium]|nr:nucleoside recognition protein [Clostridiales bacterium]